MEKEIKDTQTKKELSFFVGDKFYTDKPQRHYKKTTMSGLP